MLVLAITLAMLCPPGATGQVSDKVLEDEHYSSALQALETGLYDVAASRFVALLRSPGAVNFTTDDEQWITAQIAMAHVRAAQPTAALRAIDKLEQFPEAQFWRAHALVQLGRFQEAEQLFGRLLKESPGIHADSCRFTRARVLSELGRQREAAEELEPLISSPEPATAGRARVALAETLVRLGQSSEIESLFDPALPAPYVSQLRYVIGLVLLDEGNFPKALRVFKEVLTARDRLPPELAAAAEIGLATAQARSGQPERAAQQLVTTIERLTGSPLLTEAFALLETLELLTTANVPAKLREWSQGDYQARATLALYYAIVADEAAGLPGDAVVRYGAFAAQYPDHPAMPLALLRQAMLLARSSRPNGKDDALQALARLQTLPIPEETRQLAGFLEAKARYAIADASSNGAATPESQAAAAQRFKDAEQAFLAATGATDPETAASVQYDAAIAAMRADWQTSLEGYLQALGERTDLKGDLLLERGLYLAAKQRYRESRLQLESFIEFFPEHRRMFHAHLTLAEIAMLEFPPRPRNAMNHLDLAEKQPNLTDRQRQQIDYTRFWLEESKRDADASAMIALGNRFLETWPESPWRDAVRMKLGEHYFRIEDYPLAITMFEELEKESPDSELADAALYFAGKANTRLNPAEGPDRAIELWNRVVRKGGPLSIPALYQWALAKRRQLKFDEAAEILRKLLGDETVAGEQRKAMLCSLGETLFSQSQTQPEKLAEAVTVFNQVIALSDDLPSWRNQALYRLGKCHEQRAERAASPEEAQGALVMAKDAYDQVFATKTSPVADYLWFYRAGFQLVDLLKEEKQWDQAIAIASKLAESNGSRARHARQIAEQLRLDQFRWEN